MWELYFDNCAAAVTIFWWVLKRKCWTCHRSRLFLSHTSTGFWRVVCTCESHVGVSTVSAWENRAAQTGGPDATVRCRGGSKCSSWVLCRCPAGKLSASPDGGTGRDEDDKVHRLKWFSSEAQLGDTKAHTVSPLLSVPHAHHLDSQHSVWTEWRRQKNVCLFSVWFLFCFLKKHLVVLFPPSFSCEVLFTRHLQRPSPVKTATGPEPQWTRSEIRTSGVHH